MGGGSVELAKEISKVSVVGVGMKSHAGVATKMFSALAEKNINIAKIHSKESNLEINYINSSPEKLNEKEEFDIILNLEIIECFLEDISDPWETKNKPKHDLFND